MQNEDFSYENYCEKYINAIHSPIFAENTSSLSLKPIITYENVIWENRLNRLLRRNIIKPNVLIKGSKDGNFFSLTYKDGEDDNTNKDFPLGWKFHIAIDDSADNNNNDSNNAANSPNESNLRRGWNIVKDILIKHKVYNTKVVTPNCHFSTNHDEKQYGKQITVYASQDQRANDCAFWQKLLQEIETKLHLANIQPDPNRELSRDLSISGTGQYCSYRNDAKIKSRNLGYLHCIRYLREVPSNQRKDYLVFNNLEDPDKMSVKHFPVLNVEVSEIPRLLSADAYLIPVDLAKFLSPNRIFSTDEIIKIEALDKPWKDQLDLITARHEVIEKELREKFVQDEKAGILRSSADITKAINRAINTDSQVLALREQEVPMAMARLEKMREILGLSDPILNSVGELYQALGLLSSDNRIIDFSNRLCMNPENLYEYSLTPNGSGLQDPYARMTLYKPEPSMMSKIRNCCCPSGNEERDSRDIIHDNTQQEVTHIMERTADYTGDTTAISTALSSPNDLVRKKSCEVHEEDDLFQSSIQEVNSSSSVIAEKDSQIVSSASEAFGRGEIGSKRTIQNIADKSHLGMTNNI